MNTLFHYMYRDASNYKQFNTVILVGEITDEGRAAIKNSLLEGEYFIPSQVDLEDLQYLWENYGGLDDQDDHVWHEIVEISLTDEMPTTSKTVEELVEAFRGIKWDEAKAMRENGLVPF